MKIKTQDYYDMPDHSFKNEIHIKIDNGKSDEFGKKKEKDTEEKALKRLNNLEYNNQAIMTRHNQGLTRGSGGGIYLPANNDSHHFINNPNQMNNSSVLTSTNRVGFQPPPIPTNIYQDQNQPSNYSDLQSAFVEFLDDEPLTPEEMSAIRSLPASQQLLAIEDIKKKRGRPKGSKNKKRVSMDTQTDPSVFHSMFDNEDNVKSTPFDNPELRNIKVTDAKDHLSRTDKETKKSNAYTQHLEERKLTMNQVPPRPDRNEL